MALNDAVMGVFMEENSVACLGSPSELQNLLLTEQEGILTATITLYVKTAEILIQGIGEQDKAQVDIPQCLPGLDLTALFHHWQ